MISLEMMGLNLLVKVVIISDIMYFILTYMYCTLNKFTTFSRDQFCGCKGLFQSKFNIVSSANISKQRINKLKEVFHASVLLLIMHFVMTFSASCFDSVMMKFVVNNTCFYDNNV